MFKNCAPFTKCISKMKNIQIEDANDVDVVMSMYNLIKYSNIYSKTSQSLWHYYRNEPALDNNNIIIDFELIIIVLCLNLNKK